MNLNLQKTLRGAEIRMLFPVKKFAFLDEVSYFIKHINFYISTVKMKTGYYFVFQACSSSRKLLLVGYGSTSCQSAC